MISRIVTRDPTTAGARRTFATLLAAVATASAFALASASTVSADPPPDLDQTRDYPEATGNFTSPDAFYWKFFKTPGGRSCGIAPNGQIAGCDEVPADAPAGTNQTVVSAGAPGYFRHSDTATFTRAVDVLRVGQRLSNWGVGCTVDEEDVVTCDTYGNHGFRLGAQSATFW